MAAYSLASIAIAALIGYALFLTHCVKTAPFHDDDEGDRVFREVQRKLAADEALEVAERELANSLYRKAA